MLYYIYYIILYNYYKLYITLRQYVAYLTEVILGLRKIEFNDMQC